MRLRHGSILALLLGIAAVFGSVQGQPPPAPPPNPVVKSTARAVLVPKLGKTVKFTDRQKMKKGHPVRRAKPLAGVQAIPLPIDWAKTLTFPMLDNDQYGICMLAAAGHADQTFTGNNGSEQQFTDPAFLNQYLAASGGDNGLDEGTLLSQCWKPGIGGVTAATYSEALDVDPTNAPLVQQAIYYFGALVFMLDVPDAWINNFDPNGGAVWDAPATADQNNGHGVIWNAVDTTGWYRLQTWGSYVWITPGGVAACDPSAFVVFSPRWFNPKTGLAPNGMHITQLAQTWQQMGGNAIPASVISAFPPPGPTPPNPPSPPNPPPVPPAPPGPPVVGNIVIAVDAGAITISPTARTIDVPTGWTTTGGVAAPALTLKADLEKAGINPNVIADVLQFISDLKAKKGFAVILSDIMRIINDLAPTPAPASGMGRFERPNRVYQPPEFSTAA